MAAALLVPVEIAEAGSLAPIELARSKFDQLAPPRSRSVNSKIVVARCSSLNSARNLSAAVAAQATVSASAVESPAAEPASVAAGLRPRTQAPTANEADDFCTLREAGTSTEARSRRDEPRLYEHARQRRSDHLAAGPAALAVPSGTSRDVPVINTAIAAPIIAGVLFIVVSFRGRGPTWSVVHILRHAGITRSLLAGSCRFRAR